MRFTGDFTDRSLNVDHTSIARCDVTNSTAVLLLVVMAAGVG